MPLELPSVFCVLLSDSRVATNWIFYFIKCTVGKIYSSIVLSVNTLVPIIIILVRRKYNYCKVHLALFVLGFLFSFSLMSSLSQALSVIYNGNNLVVHTLLN